MKGNNFFNSFLLNDRGQAFTLEGVVASLIVLSSVAFALQATAITPLTASTANERVEEQSRVLADDLLDVAAEENALSPAIRYWDTSQNGFEGAGINGYSTAGPPGTQFQNLTNDALSANGLAFNVDVAYQYDANGDGEFKSTDTEKLVYQGEPSDNAVTAKRTVFLYDDMEITSSSSGTLKDKSFYAPDASPSTNLYNIVEVKITVWKI